ncbi:MAG: glycoside hydrolase family 88 protein [Oscillospiraceae bacterium]|nr:glycoside hydrolase family 88 protein [Oscillospiraceae bacterium]
MTERFFKEYLARFKPFKTYWNYEDGCLLLGCQRMFEATGRSLYAEFVLRYLSQRIEQNGSIPTYLTDAHSLDSFNCGKVLFFAADLTNEDRYRRAADWIAEQIQAHPRTKSGFCWHKEIYPEQIWIDGVYMAAPFFAQYAGRTRNDRVYQEIGRWFAFVKKHMRNPENGLYYHGLDEARAQRWANPQTGLSRSHWLRGEGWLLMALTDTLALLPESQHELRALLSGMLRDAEASLRPFRNADGCFLQVIDRQDAEGNYTETSGNLMIAYAFMRGAEMGVLDAAAGQCGAQILNTIKSEKLIQSPDGMHLTGICSAAGLGGITDRDGSCAYYLSEPVVSDDPKGVGVLMLAEAVRLQAAQRRNHQKNAV